VLKRWEDNKMLKL